MSEFVETGKSSLSEKAKTIFWEAVKITCIFGVGLLLARGAYSVYSGLRKV